MTPEQIKRLPVRHIGWIYALCSKRIKGDFRPDLGAKRYRQLGVRERFTNEKPYRVCKRCIAKVSRDDD